MSEIAAAKSLVFTLAACLLVGAPAARAGASFDLNDGDVDPGRPVATVARAADWSKARLLPAAIAVAAAEARRVSADQGELAPGADGKIDLSLPKLIDLTLRHNLDIRVESYQPALSVEALRAREAIFDPLLSFAVSFFSSTSPTAAQLEGAAVLSVDRQDWNVSLERLIPWGGSASVQFDNQRQKSNSAFSTLNPSYDSTLTFQLTQPLLRNFGRDITRREIRIAANDREISSQQFRQQVIATVTEAIDSYWDLYGKIRNLEVQNESLRLAQDLLRINRTRVEVGTMAPLEISAAEAEVARNEEQLILAEHDVQTARDRLLALIGTTSDSALWGADLRPVDTPSVEERDIDVDQAIQTALEHRPELRQRQLMIDSDQIRLEYAANQLKPGLSLQTSLGWGGLGGTQIVRSGFGDNAVAEEIPGGYGDALDQLSSFDFDTWRIGAVFELPVFNQQAEAAHATARLNVSRDQDSLAALEQAIAVDVRRLARIVGTSLKSMDAAAVTRRLQEQRLDAEQKKFEHGLSTNFEVSQAQKDLTAARTNEVIASTSYQRALAALESAKGTVLDSHGVRISE